MFPKAKKSLGQNFLVDGNYQRKILNAVQAGRESPHVLEIGPGQGALTLPLIGIAGEYKAVEKDRDLAPLLAQKIGSTHEIVVGDFLEVDLSFLEAGKPWVALGNLPYNVASQIFIRLIENRRLFSDFYLMFQKEMALRFVAKPGTNDYGLLSLWAHVYTAAKLLFDLPPTVFRPQPKVQSSFVHFALRAQPLLPLEEESSFWPMVRVLFQHRRKTLGSVLKNHLGASGGLESVDLKARAEDLPFEELRRICRLLPSREAVNNS